MFRLTTTRLTKNEARQSRNTANILPTFHHYFGSISAIIRHYFAPSFARTQNISAHTGRKQKELEKVLSIIISLFVSVEDDASCCYEANTGRAEIAFESSKYRRNLRNIELSIAHFFGILDLFIKLEAELGRVG